MKPMYAKRMIASIFVPIFLIISAFRADAIEVKFLKIKFMNAEKTFASALSEAARLKWEAGQGQEELGRLIRDGGPQGRVDQEAFGKAIAGGASLKWRHDRVQERLGAAIQKTSNIIMREEEITGNIQEELGRIILANAQIEWIDPAELALNAQRRAEIEQEKLGRDIQRRAHFVWAENELARSVQMALLSSLALEKSQVPNGVFSVLRRETGRTHEEELRMATALMDEEKGEALERILPSGPASVSSSAPTVRTDTGWGGFGEFGLPALLGFLGALSVILWFWIALDRPPSERTPADKAFEAKVGHKDKMSNVA
jgi:hypothetical protein